MTLPKKPIYTEATCEGCNKVIRVHQHQQQQFAKDSLCQTCRNQSRVDAKKAMRALEERRKQKGLRR